MNWIWRWYTHTMEWKPIGFCDLVCDIDKPMVSWSNVMASWFFGYANHDITLLFQPLRVYGIHGELE